MGGRAAKVAVSIPTSLYTAVEGARKKRGATRSAVVQDALKLWLERQRELAAVMRYVKGYRRKPETARDIAAAEAAATRLLAAEKW